jgi:ABC-2 type transport system permease protein
MVNTVKSNVKYERKKLENKNQFKALLSIEFKRLFNSKLYFLNSCIGGILVVIMSVTLGISAKDALPQLGELKKYIHFVALISMLVLGMATPASCSINMEGKNFWITKTLPIDYKVYVKAKVATSVIILGICSLVASVIQIVFIQPNIIQSIAIIVLPLLYVIAISSGDLLINLFFIKLNWKNEQEAVKNSAATLLSMLAGFVLTIIIGVSLVLLSFVSMYLGILVTTIIVGILAGLLYFINIQIIDKRIELIEQ